VTWFRDECRNNGCDGCFGIQLSCGHSFSCGKDPAFATHRCSAMWTPVLWSMFMAVAAFAIVVGLAMR